jgi:putative transposase
MRVIDEYADQLVAHLRLPVEHRKRTRSTNLLERTFVEVRRRTKIIGRFPGETSALSLIWAVLELSSRGWRGVPMTPQGRRADRAHPSRPSDDRHHQQHHRGGCRLRYNM